MNWAADCVATIPCLNEALGLADVIHGVQRFLPNVIVADDASTDATASVATALGADVVRHQHRSGKGAALQLAWNRASQRGFTWALSLDGDGQHNPEDIPNFFRCAKATGATLIIGNRMMDCANMPFLRRLANRWMSHRIAALLRAPVPDSQCGFRLMHLPSWSRLILQANHFEVESEVLVAFARAGYPVAFTPIQTCYGREFSKISPIPDTVRWVKWWLRSRRSVPTRPCTSTPHCHSPALLE